MHLQLGLSRGQSNFALNKSKEVVACFGFLFSAKTDLPKTLSLVFQHDCQLSLKSVEINAVEKMEQRWNMDMDIQV